MARVKPGVGILSAAATPPASTATTVATAAAPAAPAPSRPPNVPTAAKPAAPKTKPKESKKLPEASTFSLGQLLLGSRVGREGEAGRHKFEAEFREQEIEKQLPDFVEKLRQVRGLRQQGIIGPQPRVDKVSMFGGPPVPVGTDLTKQQAIEARRAFGARVKPAKGEEVEFPSMQPIVSQVPKTGPGGTTEIKAVPKGTPAFPSGEDLNRLNTGARKAYDLAKDYGEARQTYRQLKDAVETAQKDYRVPAAQLQEMARGAHRALEDVAKLRASLREFGWTNDQEVEEKFGPK